MRRRLFVGLIVVAAIGGPGGAHPAQAQNAEYDLREVIERVFKWGSDAMGYNQYRWQKTRDELTDSIAQSTIKLVGVPIDSQRIDVVGGRARYQLTLDLSGGVTPDWPLSFSMGSSLSQATQSPIRGTESYNEGRVRTLQLNLVDSADRMALELSGHVQVNVFGRVRAIKVNASAGVITCDIDLTTWTARQGLETHSAAKELKSSLTSALATGSWQEAERSFDQLQRAAPTDPDLARFREALKLAGRWTVSHDHGMQLIQVPGVTPSCQGTLEVRGAWVSFRSSEHEMSVRADSAYEIRANQLVKGFHIKLSRAENYNFDAGPSTNQEILAAIERATSMP